MGRLMLWLALALLLSAGGGLEDPAPGGPGDPYGSPLYPDTFVISELAAQAAAPPGSAAFVRIDVHEDKTLSLVVRAFVLPPGEYEVVRDGFDDTTPLGSFTVGSDGQGKLTPGEPDLGAFLDWSQHADTIEVFQGEALLFSGHMEPMHTFMVAIDDNLETMLNGARLIAVGSDLDARGRLICTSGWGYATEDLRMERLDPGPYFVEVAGQPEIYLGAGPGGTAKMRLVLPLKPGLGQATFYSPGQDIRVRNASGEIVLEAQMPNDLGQELSRPPKRQKFHDVGDGAADGLSIDFVAAFNTWVGGPKDGTFVWTRDKLGDSSVTVTLKESKELWPVGPFEIFVGNASIGSVEATLGAPETWQATFAVSADLDPRGQRVVVRNDDDEFLALIFPQSVPAALRTYHKDLRKPHHLRLDLLNPGTDLDATGRLDWRVKKGVEQLKLEVHDLPAGAYDVAIDGAVVAPGALLVDADGGDATQLFSTGAAVEGSLPLDFAVDGELEIHAAGNEAVYLQQSLAH